MLHGRRITASFIVASVLAGCHGGPDPSALPSLPLSNVQSGVSPDAVQFRPIGPTHMSDGLPTSGKVNAYAVDPANPKIIYMASGRGTGLETYSSAGILRTKDGGASWTPVVNGLTDRAGVVSSVVNGLWLDSANPAVLLAATEYDGIFRSSDGGSSWTNVYRTTQATQIVSYNDVVYAAAAAGLLTSSDHGASWTVQLAGTKTVHPRAFGMLEGSKAHAFYAGMTDGSIWSFSDAKWTKVGTLPYDRHTGTDGSQPDVHQIAVDPHAPSIVYASSNDGAWDQDLHASTNGGKTWKKILAQKYYSYGLGTQAIAYSAVHPDRLYVGADGFMYYIAGDGSPNPQAHPAANLSVIDVRNVWVHPNGSDDACWIASDQGLDYESTCSGHGSRLNDTVVSAPSATGLARRFTVSPDGKALLVSLQDFGSHFTGDGGSTWRLDNALYEDGFNELRPGTPSVCYSYDEASGLSVSNDGCASFSSLQGGIFPSRLMTTPIAFVPEKPLTMYVISGPNVSLGFNGPKGVYGSTDGGSDDFEATVAVCLGRRDRRRPAVRPAHPRRRPREREVVDIGNQRRRENLEEGLGRSAYAVLVRDYHFAGKRADRARVERRCETQRVRAAKHRRRSQLHARLDGDQRTAAARRPRFRSPATARAGRAADARSRRRTICSAGVRVFARARDSLQSAGHERHCGRRDYDAARRIRFN